MVEAGPTTQHGLVPVRLATFNIRHGLLPDGRVDLGYLGEAVAGLDADVVVLQEVDRGQVRSGGADTAREVARATGATDFRFLPAVAGRMEPRRVAAGGSLGADGDPARVLEPLVRAEGLRARGRAVVRILGSRAGRAAVGAYLRTWLSRHPSRAHEHQEAAGYGIALVSRLPVREWRRLRLPLASRWLFGRLQLGRDEPRVAIVAVVDTEDGPLTVVTTHLSSGSDWNRTQLRWLAARLRDLPRPLVLLGDLNLRGTVPTELTGWRDLVAEPTYPRERPRLQLDHVLVDDGPGVVRSVRPAQVLDLGISDHRAVVVDLALGPHAAPGRRSPGESPGPTATVWP